MDPLTPIYGFVEWLAFASIKTTPLIILLLLLRKFFVKKIPANALYLLWGSVLISLVAPLGWQFEITPNFPKFTMAPKHNTTLPEENNLAHLINIPREPTTSHEEQVKPMLIAPSNAEQGLKLSTWLKNHFNRLIALIWLAGLAYFSAATIRNIIIYRKKISDAQAINGEEVAIFNGCLKRMKLNKTVRLLESSSILSPVVVGWLTPCIILPKHLMRALNREQLEFVLLHEINHIKRHDILFNWSICAVQILHWFNPLLWYSGLIIRRDLEAACDAGVLKELKPERRRLYGATLIELSDVLQLNQPSIIAVGILENHRELADRITMIKHFKRFNLKTASLFSIILVISAVAAVAQPLQRKAVERFIDTQQMTLEDLSREFSERSGRRIQLENQNKNAILTFNENIQTINLDTYLAVLNGYQFVAYQNKQMLHVLEKDEVFRFHENIPPYNQRKTYSHYEYIQASIPLKNSCAYSIGAIIRPMLKEHDVITTDNKTIKLVVPYGQLSRLEKIITDTDSRQQKATNCESNFVGLIEKRNTETNQIVSSKIKGFNDPKLRGSVVIYSLTSPNCHNCIETIEAMNTLHEEFKQSGLRVISVNTPAFDEILKITKNKRKQGKLPVLDIKALSDTHSELVSRHNIQYPTVMPSDWWQLKWLARSSQSGVNSLIIDKNGFKRYEYLGFNEASEEQYRNTIIALLNE